MVGGRCNLMMMPEEAERHAGPNDPELSPRRSIFNPLGLLQVMSSPRRNPLTRVPSSISLDQPPTLAPSSSFVPISANRATMSVIMWGFSSFLFFAPAFFKCLGIGLCLTVAVCHWALNMMSHQFIYNASFFAGTDYLPGIVRTIIGPRFGRIFRVTLFLDVTLAFLTTLLSLWKQFAVTIVSWKLVPQEWMVSKDQQSLQEYHPQVFKMRVLFYAIAGLLFTPFFLKEKISELTSFLRAYFCTVVVVLLIILVQMPGYRESHIRDGTHQISPWAAAPTLLMVEAFFNILSVLYFQPYILTLKAEMADPQPVQISRSRWIYSSVIQGTYLFFGLCVYLCMGNNYTPYFILDKKAPEIDPLHLEKVLSIGYILLFLFAGLWCLLFNPTYRPILADILDLDLRSSRVYRTLSLLPYALLATVAILFPVLYRYMSLFGNMALLFNGYIVPCLLQLRMCEHQGQSWARKPLILAIVLFSLTAIVGQFFVIYTFAS